MKSLSRLTRIQAITSLLLLLFPAVSQAQSPAAEAAFTRHALLIGFLVLSVILLVFLALMLKARVNELASFTGKDAPPKESTVARQLLSLSESDIDGLLMQKMRPPGNTAKSAAV
jgi:competence protein ComGC